MKILFLIIVYGYFIAPLIMIGGGYLIHINWNWTGGLVIAVGAVLLLARLLFNGVNVQ